MNTKNYLTNTFVASSTTATYYRLSAFDQSVKVDATDGKCSVLAFQLPVLISHLTLQWTPEPIMKI